MKLEIRNAAKEDAKCLSKLFIEFVGSESNLDRMKRQLEIISKRPDYYVVVATTDDEVIGTAMGIICMDIVGNCNPYMLVENVVVSSAHQGKGIGKELMKALEDYAKEVNCNYLMLASSENRVQAHQFYESIGYQGNKRGFIKRL